MLLRPDLAVHQRVPKEYTLDITAEKVNNTFVFTEQDLPGYKSRTKAKTLDPLTANMPARLTRPKPEKTAPQQPYDKNRKWQPYIRKAVPKKTILKGTVAHEVNCVAVDNAESRHIIAVKTAESMRAKTGTLHLSGASSALTNGFINPGTIQSQGAFGGFIVSAMSHEAKWHKLTSSEKQGPYEGENTRNEDCTYAKERTLGSIMGMFPTLQILVHESVTRRIATTRSISARSPRRHCRLA